MVPDHEYDIIVVGAGPAGSTAARIASENGASVLLLERDREVGTPVRCAEAVGKDGIERILEHPVRPEWIAEEINKFKLVAPDGTAIYPQVNMVGYVLYRRIFDHDLAAFAAGKGVHVITSADVQGLIYNEDYIAGVICNIKGTSYRINAKIVIGADGVESRVGRWAGLKMTIRMRDMETCSQATIYNPGIEPGVCQFYFSQEKFPGGYAWVFPKGNSTANVGLGISGNLIKKQSADKRLQLFLDQYYPNASVLSRTVGGVPCADRPARISGNGILLVGDAAYQTNPMSGGGITSGMAGAKIAGRIAAEAFDKNDFSADFFKKYENQWDKTGGKNQKKYYKIKEGIQKLDDEQLNKTAQIIDRIPHQKQTLLKIFQTALSTQPSLLVDLVKLLSPFS